MKPYGTYKIRYQRSHGDARADAAEDASPGDPLETLLGEIRATERRAERIVDSLHQEIVEGGDAAALRIRRVFSKPREIFRVELERPDMGYQRTILLGREALEALLERDGVEPALGSLALAG
jgi:hypothetical protein